MYSSVCNKRHIIDCEVVFFKCICLYLLSLKVHTEVVKGVFQYAVSLDELKVTLYDIQQHLVVDVFNVGECS